MRAAGLAFINYPAIYISRSSKIVQQKQRLHFEVFENKNK